MTGERPLAAVLARLDAVDPWCGYSMATPQGAGWHRLDEVVADDRLVASWLAGLRARTTKGCSDVAGSYLASWLGSLLAGPVATQLVGERRAWRLAPRSLAVRRHEGGWFDAVAVAPQPLLVLPGDPLATHPDVAVVVDEATLRDRVADDLVALLNPVFAHIRAHASFGLGGMWGTVADAVADQVVQYSAAVAASNGNDDDRDDDGDGDDAEASWPRVAALIDALAARAPRLRVRPSLVAVGWSGGVAHRTARGTCCLYYKLSGDDWCANCPKRAAADRECRWVTDLEARQLAAT